MAGNQVNFSLHTHAGKSDRVFNPFLIINGIFLRDHMQNPMLITYAYRLSGMHHVLYIFLRDFLF
ncbi:hypothetical protein SRABI106_03674 [Rahnella aquatilis]|nr:hypothetical protein SRABI106_03674 [Rahnella aquatilis]